MMIAVPIGRAKVRVTIEGCRGCGTLYSPSWHEVATVTVLVGKKTIQLAIHECGDCFEGRSDGKKT
jgi:hypothetical protein